MKTILFLIASIFVFYIAPTYAVPVTLTDTTESLVVDDITITALGHQINTEAGTVTIKLALRSEKEVPREFKLNVYGTQVVDNNRQAHFFQTITMGRVTVHFDDRQNYLHYLLQPDTQVELTIVADNIPAEAEQISLVKLVFEDSTTEGRFVQAFLAHIPIIEE